ncbi:MAG: hypothetical protein JO354_03095 [Verrucomicrobia bacterium]|nr:hypothetical protein [Verrucomicrobiota bacterium]
MPQQHSGFSLIEVTLAIGVAAVSMLAIFGLLASGSQSNFNAAEQSAANDMLSAVIADLRATPLTTPRGQAATSPQFGIQIPANPVAPPAPSSTTLYLNPQGRFSTTPSTTWQYPPTYKLTVSFIPNAPNTRAATLVDVTMSWPVFASSNNVNAGSAEMFVALDRN